MDILQIVITEMPVGSTVALDNVEPVNELTDIVWIAVLVRQEELLEFRILLTFEMW